MTVVIGTAGHIDHGKTTLLRALTGIDADRLPEERRRGLTIDIGYAHGSPDGGPELDFVDVPGHDRLVGNMLVGVAEIDAALLVIAADDGPRAQTWEHLGLLDAMGVEDAIVAITKVDVVDDERLAEVVAESIPVIARTRLAGSSLVAVSAVTGQGLDALRSELAALRERLDERQVVRREGAWLAVDRAFVARGHGVVVTGSSRGADIQVGDSLQLGPGSGSVRVRGVHIHDEALERSVGRGRLALNLSGLELDDVRRGQVLTSPGGEDSVRAAFDSHRLLVVLHARPALPGRPGDDPWPPPDGARLRLHIGTDQLQARLGRLTRVDRDSDPDPVFAVLRLEREVATAIGERFVLRRPPPAGLLAGGTVLDGAAPAGRARSRIDRERLMRLYRAVAEGVREPIEAALTELHGVHGMRLAPDVDAAVSSAIIDAVEAHHVGRPDVVGLELSAARSLAAAQLRRRVSVDEPSLGSIVDDVIRRLLERGVLVRVGDRLQRPGFQPLSPDPAITTAMEALVAMLDQDAPPPLAAAATQAGCPPEVVRELERAGRIVIVGDDLGWSAGAFERHRDRAIALAVHEPVTPAALRDASGTSRKYVMALLEELDRRGILRRTPEGHVRGPRA